MEPVTRQLTSQSNRSLFVVALDQNGPMISHVLETIHCHDTSDDDESSNDTIQRIDQRPSQSLKKTFTVTSETTIQDFDQKSIDQSIIQPTITNKTNKDVLENNNNNIPLWKFWKKNAGRVDPKTFSNAKKNFILFIVAIAGCSAPLSSTIYYPALIDMQKSFNTTDTIMNVTISIFTFFLAFFPLLWAAAGERFGRRKIYLISFIISTIGSLLCGLSVNIVMLIIFRAVNAIGASSVMSMGAGTLSDLFETHERGRAFAWYTCGPLLGPAIGPILGGLLNSGLGFRSIFYFLAIFNLCILFGIFFFLPETSQPFNDVSKTENQQSDKKRKALNPLSALDLFLNKNIVLCVAFIGVLFFSIYIVSATFSRTYASLYGFQSSIVGVCYLPNAVGSMVGGITGGKLSDKRYVNNAIKLNKSQNDEELAVNGDGKHPEKIELKKPYPELRLGGSAFYGAIILQLLAITAYGWCIQERVHFAYGLVCQFFYGFGLMFPNVILSTYMVDCFRKRGASVTACNNFTRYVMGGIGSLVSSDFQTAIGSGGLYTFLGAFLTLFGVNLILVQMKGNAWRQEKNRKRQEKGLKVDTLT